MISKNVVDLTGMVWNVTEKEYEGRSVLGFSLSVHNNYKDSDGEWQTDYDNVWCVYAKKKENPKNESKYNHLLKVLENKVIIRIQGRLSSWTKELGNEKVSQHNIQIRDYEIIKDLQVSDESISEDSIPEYGFENLPFSTKFGS